MIVAVWAFLLLGKRDLLCVCVPVWCAGFSLWWLLFRWALLTVVGYLLFFLSLLDLLHLWLHHFSLN